MMQHQTGKMQGQDGVAIFTQDWLPDSDPKACIFLIHGLAEHSGRYVHVAEFFTANGYAVYAADLYGHGGSGGDPRCAIDRYDRFLDDLGKRLSVVEAACDGKPLFVLGHSMGGALALALTARHQAGLAGVITSGAGVSVGEVASPLLKMLSKVLGAIVPNLPVLELPAEAVSRDPAVREKYDNDPLNYRGKVRARMGAEILRLGEDVQAALPSITIPALILHGGEDALADPASGPLVERLIGSADKTLKMYPGLYHEILNEPEQDEVMADILAWLEAHR